MAKPKFKKGTFFSHVHKEFDSYIEIAVVTKITDGSLVHYKILKGYETNFIIGTKAIEHVAFGANSPWGRKCKIIKSTPAMKALYG